MAQFTDVLAVKVALDGMANFERDLRSMADQFQNIERIAVNAAGAIGVALTGATLALGVAAIKAGAAEMRLEDAIKRLYGDSAKGLIRTIGELDNKTQFLDTTFLEAAKYLGTLGISAAEADAQLRVVADTIAFLGGTDEDVLALSKALALLATEGTAGARALQAVTRNLGLNVFEILEKQLGIDLGDELKAPEIIGSLPRSEVVSALMRGLREAYGTGMERAMRSPLNRFAEARQSIDDILDEIGKSLITFGAALGPVLVGIAHGFEWINSATGGQAGMAVLLAGFAIGLRLIVFWVTRTFGAVNSLTQALTGLTGALTGATAATTAATGAQARSATTAGAAAVAGTAGVLGGLRAVLGRSGALRGIGPALGLGLGAMAAGLGLDALEEQGTISSGVGDFLENVLGGAALGGGIGLMGLGIGAIPGALIGALGGALKYGLEQLTADRSGAGKGESPETAYARETANNTKAIADSVKRTHEEYIKRLRHRDVVALLAHGTVYAFMGAVRAGVGGGGGGSTLAG